MTPLKSREKGVKLGENLIASLAKRAKRDPLKEKSFPPSKERDNKNDKTKLDKKFNSRAGENLFLPFSNRHGIYIEKNYYNIQ